MKACCNGCTGTSASNHPVVTNRPGLSALSYRIGTYGTFFAAMKARLSGGDLSFPPTPPPLAGLKIRDQSDPAIALLDAWAVLADVLTFYQERIANEAYLRTATERQSIVALASLVGATLRPGVSASTYLAYTIDPNAQSSIPAGSKVQSIPGPGELPHSFETSEDFAGKGSFSDLSLRLSRPQVLLASNSTIYLSGLSNNVNVNDPLLLVTATQDIRRVAKVNINATNSLTAIGLQSESSAPASFAVAAKVSTHMTAPSAEAGAESPSASSGTASASLTNTMAPEESLILGAMEGFLAPLAKPPSSHPATPLDLKRRLSDVYQTQLDTAPKLVRALHSEAADEIYPALAAAAVTPAPAQQLFAFRIKAPVYGHNAPLKPITNQNGIVIGTEEWPLNGSISVLISINGGNDSPHAVLSREEAKAFVSVTQANTSSSGMLTIPKANSTDTTKIGPWDIKIASALSNKQPQITITFPGLDRLYTITIETHGLVNVVTDGPAVVVPMGQSGTSDASGRHLLVSTVSGLLISDDAPAVPDQPNVINLDSVYDKIMPGSWIYLERSDNGVMTQKKTMVKAVAQVSLNTYGIPARVSQLTLEEAWLDPQSDRLLTVARNTTVYAQSELLPLAEEPIADPIAGNTIELKTLYSDLQPGRWLIVSGERADIPGISGILASELVMLAAVKQGVAQIPAPQPPVASINLSSDSSSDIPSNLSSGSGSSTPIDSSQPSAPILDSSDTPETLPLPGDTTHSFLQFASPLAYSYKRETVTVYGNVVPATNGETRKEVLGSGDSSQAFQQFQLHASPLTYVSGPTVSGAVSTLAIYVNGIQWHEVDSLMTCRPTDRIFVTSADEQDTVTITFGDGIHGMRLPTGQENVQAIYRVGIGSGGNLGGGKLSLLSTRPLGVRAVINPMASTGGADRDSSDAGRRNIPVASIALDRLVSVSDYASFARTFAGIGKATSAMLSDKHRQIVVVSVSGAEGSVIAPQAQVVTQLTQAFQQLGDPYLPVAVLVTNPLLLVISAQIKLLPDYQWINVVPLLRASLLAAFSFDVQVPGSPVYLSAVTSVIQQVAGVEYCVMDGFGTISRADVDSADALQSKFAQLAASTTVPESIALQLEHANSDGQFLPSAIAFLSPDVPDALLLTEIA